MSGGRHGAVIWLTGRPASGKTTVAAVVIERLRAAGVATLWLDSDDLRTVLTPAPTYSDAERDAFYGALGHLAKLGAAGGVTVVVSATAPRRRYRDEVRRAVPHFLEVYLTAPLSELTRRDPKGLYAATRVGAVERLPGLGADYEEPLAPELVIPTERTSFEEAAEHVLAAHQAMVS